MNKFICIHGHFYQPPRENPWLNEVELQPSAYPYHDWNERITAECYARNSASRILDKEGHITDIINNYSRISFNFGPTLLEWMERKSPDVYHAILQADKQSMERFSGHGSAIAQVYNHMIMPLANERDKHTQVIWGIRDFEKRFGRYPEGMWLSETAVDTVSLEVLAEYDIKFTILSPYQAKRFRKTGDKTWKDAEGGKIDPKNSYVCHLPSGKSINLFFYDGPVSQAVAFEKLLNNGEHFAERILGPLKKNVSHPQLMHIATDGETYGHHHRFGEMALTYALHHIETNELAKLTIYGEYMDKFPVEDEVEIIENTSWSCVHGIERWRSDCGCSTGGNPGWNQKWRAPLRKTFDWVREKLNPLYEQMMSKYVKDPWKVRNEYIQVIHDRSRHNVSNFIEEQTSGNLKGEEEVKFLKLLEMQYHVMLMYTSCGWFFDDVTGIETVQDISYAARAIQLANQLSDEDYETDFVKQLENAESNIPEHRNAAEAYRKFVEPAAIDLMRVGAHYAISSLFEEYPTESRVYSFSVHSLFQEKQEAGKQKLSTGKASFRSRITWEKDELSYAVLHLGEHNMFGGVRKFKSKEAFESMKQEITEAFQKSNAYEVVALMDKHFGTHSYSFWHLFRDHQVKVLDIVLENTLINVEGMYRQIYENNYQIMKAILGLDKQIPEPLKTTIEYTINTRLKKALKERKIDLHELKTLIDEAKGFRIKLDKPTLEFLISRRITRMMKEFNASPETYKYLEGMINLVNLTRQLPLQPDLWKAQNFCIMIKKKYYPEFEKKGSENDTGAKRWLKLFDQLYTDLNMTS